jgi:hypothetical protein
MRKTVQLTCEWCTAEWNEGDPAGDWFVVTYEFADDPEEEHEFCCFPCFQAWL